MPKQFSYPGLPIAITVKIHDPDVTNDLASMGGRRVNFSVREA